MATLLNMLDRVKAMDVSAIVTETMEAVTPDIKASQQGQMLKGLNARGTRIGMYRSGAYAVIKNRMNPVPGYGVPDLKLTGEFHREIYAEIRGDKVIIDSVNEKTEALAKKYGEEIFGLNAESKTTLIEDVVRPQFMKKVRDKLKL
jgi:hypothetical protein